MYLQQMKKGKSKLSSRSFGLFDSEAEQKASAFVASQ